MIHIYIHIYILQGFSMICTHMYTYLFERYSFYSTYSHLERHFYDSHIYAFCKAFSWFYIYTFCKAFFCYLPIIHIYIFATYLTYIHICKAFWLPIHSILNGIFCYMSIFYSHICTYTWEATSCYMFTHTHIRLRSTFVLYIHTYIHSFERQFLCYQFTFLKGNFMSYIHIWRSIFVLYSTYVRFIWKVFSSCYLFYVYMYTVKNIFTPSKCKEIIMMQPKPSAGLKGKPHQHALISMPSYIQNQKA